MAEYNENKRQIDPIKVVAIIALVSGALFGLYGWTRLQEQDFAWTLLVAALLVGAGVLLLVLTRDRGVMTYYEER